VSVFSDDDDKKSDEGSENLLNDEPIELD